MGEETMTNERAEIRYVAKIRTNDKKTFYTKPLYDYQYDQLTSKIMQYADSNDFVPISSGVSGFLIRGKDIKTVKEVICHCVDGEPVSKFEYNFFLEHDRLPTDEEIDESMKEELRSKINSSIRSIGITIGSVGGKRDNNTDDDLGEYVPTEGKHDE